MAKAKATDVTCPKCGATKGKPCDKRYVDGKFQAVLCGQRVRDFQISRAKVSG